MRNLAARFNEKSLPCVKGGGFAEQTRRDCNCESKNISSKVKAKKDNPSVNFVDSSLYTREPQGSLKGASREPQGRLFIYHKNHQEVYYNNPFVGSKQ